MTVIDTPSGRIHGTTALTRRADVQCYLGIPFAASPVGRLRFQPPAPVEPWKGVLKAKRHGMAAPQNSDPVMERGGYYQPPSGEDGCLNLNVWTARADGAKRPVMVWIHGGAYVTGSNATGNNSGAELAATFDVVVVSINYRLGALGFLYLADRFGDEFGDSGNLAILDQLAALAWVRDNIAAFGGDPDDVTVFGESAGGAAVGTLLGTPRAEGLFRRAIVQSGTAERARSTADSAAVTDQFLEALGEPDIGARALQELPLARILAAQHELASVFAATVVGLPLPFQPVIDGRVLPRLPLESIRAGVNSTVDLLAGTNLNEASFFTELRPEGAVDPLTVAQKLEILARADFDGDESLPERYAATLASVLGRTPTENQVLESYLSDQLYRQPTNRLLDARAGSAGDNYAYLFAWPSPLLDGRLGSCHALDVPFVFRQLHRIESVSLVGDDAPQSLSDAMSAAWVRFADQGAPASASLPHWPTYEASDRSTMILDLDARVENDPRAQLRRLWAARVPV